MLNGAIPRGDNFKSIYVINNTISIFVKQKLQELQKRN